MRVPRATYRLQLHAGFTLDDAAEVLPYLERLGVSHAYCSPYTESRPGSAHGYDVVEHNRVDPELGSEEALERFIERLAELGMGHILDFVPNHMGIGSDNPRWMDVLRHGPASPSARFFDIDWHPTNRPELSGKVLLPFLGDHYRSVLESGELALSFEAEEGAFHAAYYEHRFPVDPATYPLILEDTDGIPEEHAPEFGSLVSAFSHLPGREETAEARVEERLRDSRVNQERLARLCKDSGEVRRAIDRRIQEINADPGALHTLLERQAYRVVYWRVSSDEINYRRFFSIDDLAGIRQEDPEVFDAVHGLILRLISEGNLDGVRIDHIDGLYDPAGYLERLQGESAGVEGGEPVYLLVEKILAPHEHLPSHWPVAGTTGYEFTNLINALFVDPEGEAGMEAAYRRFLGERRDFEELLERSKREVMRSELASELNVLSRRLLTVSDSGQRTFDFTINTLRDALRETIAVFPVYRTYISDGGPSDQDRRYIEWAIARAKKASTAADTSAFEFIREVLLGERGGEAGRAFVMKLQQYTGPVMAKGMEDTALYRYNRLSSLNEVGGEPQRFGVSPAAFHHVSAERAREWPDSMLTTSTHDTKRSEDVRTRIDVLSELPGEWRRALRRWSRINRLRRRETEAGTAPSPNDEYLLYQTLIGTWPLQPLDDEALSTYRARIQAYMQKAMREAEERTSWVNVNEDYERGVAEFIDEILESPQSLFVTELWPLARRAARLGALYSLSQTLVKLTAPGVPDIYQGTELWDYSLVDPDNRRPVDYGLRRSLLERMDDTQQASSLLGAGEWEGGAPKLYVIKRALDLRRRHPALFERGEYAPLHTEGERGDHLLTFARQNPQATAVTVTPRLMARFAGQGRDLRLPGGAWGRTTVEMPHNGPYRNLLTGEVIYPRDGSVSAGALLNAFPVALLLAEG